MKDKQFELEGEEHIGWEQLRDSGLDKPFTGIQNEGGKPEEGSWKITTLTTNEAIPIEEMKESWHKEMVMKYGDKQGSGIDSFEKMMENYKTLSSDDIKRFTDKMKLYMILAEKMALQKSMEAYKEWENKRIKNEE